MEVKYIIFGHIRHVVHVPLPARETRYKLLVETLKHHNFSDDDFNENAACTDGYSPSDMMKLCEAVSRAPITKLQNCNYFCKVSENGNGEVTYEPCLFNEQWKCN